MLEIKGVVKHADWGGLHHIPLMLSQDYSNSRCSEYLFTGSSSDIVRLVDSSNFCEWLKAAPEARLGVSGIEAFGCQLPFSVRLVDVDIPRTVSLYSEVLDVKMTHGQMRTSHGSKGNHYLDAAGQKTFMITVSDVVLLDGFLSINEILEKLSYFDMLSDVREVFERFGVKGGLSFILRVDESFASILVERVYAAYSSRFENSEISTQDNLYWFMKTVNHRLEFGEKLSSDVLLMLFMKVNRVKPQSVVYIDSGCAFSVLNGCYFELTSPFNSRIDSTDQPPFWSIGFLKQVDVSKSVLSPLISQTINERTSDYRVAGCCFRVTSYELMAGELVTIPNQEFPSLWVVAKGEVLFNTQQHYSYPGAALYQRPQEFNTLASTHESFVYRFSVQMD